MGHNVDEAKKRISEYNSYHVHGQSERLSILYRDFLEENIVVSVMPPVNSPLSILRTPAAGPGCAHDTGCCPTLAA